MKHSVDERLVVLHRRTSPQLEQYNALRDTLERWSDGEAQRIVAVTSPAAGDGKTTTAVNLAGVLAHRADARILLVDADLRRPRVRTVLGVEASTGGAGLADAIMEPDRDLESVVTALPDFNLHVLFAGRPSDDPYELLRAPRMAGLLEDARRQYDFVIVDTSPFLLVPDARSLERFVDGFLLVVSAHRTPRRLVDETLNLIAPAKLIGLVFNGADRPSSSGYNGYDEYSGAASRRDTAGKSARR